ncbi:hypothetical protein RR46_11708 [Papilio xuthus]|uniref:Uncharacterized protein n=1 Tax=Papilio xuthus TaxID=66420 RepID=I4DQN2_PAPXU|nr:hypothetical protein RR46_11708 [Papilio xuthus]BAM20222.1 unknown unsecreted protein [Papilio xuthus]
MLLSFEVIATFGVSALVSFSVFSVLLLAIVSKSGLLQVKGNKEVLTKQFLSEHLLRPQDMPAPTAPEITPSFARRLLLPQAS